MGKSTLILCLMLLSSPVLAADHWTAPYNTVWNTPGTKGHDSMPVGGGNISINIWGEKDAVVFYIGSSDSWNDGQLLTKLARVRVAISPNPFGKDFQQELDLASNSAIVSGRCDDGNAVTLRVWVDVFQPVVHIEGQASRPVSATVTLETLPQWAVTAAYDGDAVQWQHRNASPSKARLGNIKAWGLDSVADQIPDPLSNLTYGGRLSGAGMVAEDGSIRPAVWRLKTVEPMRTLDIRATLRIAQDPSLETWEAAVKQLEDKTHSTAKSDREKNEAWWREFWDRSRIVINSGKGPDNEAWQVGRNYQLFRAMLAANRDGRFPTLFNGGHFTCDANPDSRAWADCRFMAQNQRLLYWPLLKSGDTDILKVGLDYYADLAKVQAARIKLKLGVDGVIYDESLNLFGLGNFPNASGLDNHAHLRYHFTSGMEFALMMLEANKYWGVDLKPYLPVVEGALVFFDQFYRKQSKERTGRELDDLGHLVIEPGNALELYQGTCNGTDTVAGLMALADTLLALPDGTLPAGRRAFVQEFRKRLPPLATRMLRGHTVLSPAQAWRHEGSQANAELPQLYPVFPFRQYGVGKPDLELARNTWWFGHKTDEMQKPAYCWYQGNIFTACLGLTHEAKAYTLAKFRFPFGYDLPKGNWGHFSSIPRTRYPVFYDTPQGFCQIPDMDHGGSAMVGLQEMLLQTEGKKIFLFPAWPKEWDVDFKLHAPFQTTVEVKFCNGKIEKLSVTPPSRAADIVDLSGVEPPPLPAKPLNPKDGLCIGKTAKASSVFSRDFGPEKAVDGNLRTRWAAALAVPNSWLEVDLGQPTLIGRALISEVEWKMTREFVLETRVGEGWKELAHGTTIGEDRLLEFPPIEARIVRLRITQSEKGSNINEFQVYPPTNQK